VRVVDMAGGGWWLVVGGWWLVVGGWWLVVGGWWLAGGGWRVARGAWLVAVGGWRLAVGAWLLARGSWWLVVGGWRLAAIARTKHHSRLPWSVRDLGAANGGYGTYVVRLEGNPAVFDRVDDGLRTVVDFHLLQDAADVVLDCFLADE
jgi:hypothetical protein